MSDTFLLGANVSVRQGNDMEGQQERRTVHVHSRVAKEDMPIRDHQVTVKVRLVFLKIGEIDTLKENYAADIFVYTVWREPSLDGRNSKDVENLDFSKYWNPRLFVDNTLGDPKEELWQSVQFDDSGQASMIEKKRIKGTFLENLELKHFPFDTQDLSITITTERSDTEMELLTDDKKLSSINVQSFIDAQEWDLHTHVETSKKVTTKEYSGSQLKCPALVFTCRAARRPGFFIYNILLIMFFICTLAFVTYSVEKKLTQNRLQLSFTLVLTGVAFKFVVNQSLPKISYLTYLDKYILVSMFILCLVCFWHAIVSVLLKTMGDTEKVNKADIFALVVIGILYIIFHIVFFVHIYLDAGKRRRLMYKKDQEYKERKLVLEAGHRNRMMMRRSTVITPVITPPSSHENHTFKGDYRS